MALKKKYLIITLACVTFVGAWFAMLASNMLGSDLGNKAVGFANMTIFASMPAVFVALTFVVALLYLVRVHKHPDCKKRLSRLYLIYAIVFGALGFVFSILAGATVYHNFVGPNPFPGYLIIFMVLEVAQVCAGVFFLLKLKKLPEDTDKIQIKVSYVFKTIGWFLFICLLLNRLGMFVTFPFYVYLRNFYKTFPFYLYLLLPTFLGVIEVMHIFKWGDKKLISILTYVALGLNVVFFAYTALMGINDTGFISSVSVVMPLERLASKPLEILIHFLAYTGVGVALIVQNKKAK